MHTYIHTYIYIYIHTCGRSGAVRSLGFDQFLTVDLMSSGGRFVYAANTTDLQNGSYAISYRLPPGVGDATLSMSYLDRPLNGESCGSPNLNRFSRLGLSTSTATVRRITVIQRKKPNIISTRASEVIPECSLSFASWQHPGWWDGAHWQPLSCRWRNFTQDSAQQCLAGRTMIFAGDSHMREQFVSLVALLGGPPQFKFQEDRSFTVGLNTSLRFWWTNSAFLAPPHLKDPEAIPPDFFYLSLYLADYGSYFRGVDAFAAEAAMSTEALGKQYPAARMFWHLPHAIHPGKSHRDWRIMNGWEQQRQIREALRRALQVVEGLEIFDPWELTRPRSDLSKDGNHYWQEGTPSRRGGIVVEAKVQILLNLICRSEANIGGSVMAHNDTLAIAALATFQQPHNPIETLQRSHQDVANTPVGSNDTHQFASASP